MSPRPALSTRRLRGKSSAAATRGPASAAPASHAAGFSLIELMIGLSLGLFTLLAMSQAYIAFHFQHRTGNGGMAAQTGAMSALFAIERDLQQAGRGFGDRRVLGCDARQNAGASMLLVPVRIARGTGGAPDRLDILSGNGTAAPARLGAVLAPGAPAIALASTLDMHVADMLALQEAGRPCALVRIATVDSALRVSRAALDGSALQADGDAVAAGGYSADAMAFNLGRLTRVSYAIRGTVLQRTLTSYDGASATTQDVADNIVSLRAQYGFDMRPNENPRVEVQSWGQAILDADGSGTTGDRGDWQRLAGVRLAVVARSPFRQGTGDGCNTTVAGAANAPGWQLAGPDGVLASSDISLAHLPDWKCYRYRVYETVVPLRNVVWGAP